MACGLEGIGNRKGDMWHSLCAEDTGSQVVNKGRWITGDGYNLVSMETVSSTHQPPGQLVYVLLLRMLEHKVAFQRDIWKERLSGIHRLLLQAESTGKGHSFGNYACWKFKEQEMGVDAIGCSESASCLWVSSLTSSTWEERHFWLRHTGRGSLQ